MPPGIPDPLFTPPQWAESGTATKPGLARILNGRDAGDPIPAEEYNYLLREAFRRIAISPPLFTSLEDAADGLVDASTGALMEQPFVLDEHDANHAPGGIHTSTVGAADIVSIACTGESIITASSVPALREYGRDTTTVIQVFTPAHAFVTIQKVVTNGKYVVAAYTMAGPAYIVECWLRSTGASLWHYDNGDVVNDLAIDGNRVYVVNDTGVVLEARALNLVTGALVWAYDHGASLVAVATNGYQTFVGGGASPHASGAIIRALVASSGFDAANEGGTGLDTTNTAWDNDGTGPPAFTDCVALATDGRQLWAVTNAAPSDLLQELSSAVGTYVQSVVIVIGVGTHVLSADHGLLCSAQALGAVVRDKKTLAIVWQYIPAVGGFYDFRTDGAAIFFGGPTGGGAITLGRLYRGNRASLWRSVDPDDNFLPYRQILIPQEG